MEEEEKVIDAEANLRDKKGKRVIVVLERAGLETVKTKRGYELLNADTHKVKYRPPLIAALH